MQANGGLWDQEYPHILSARSALLEQEQESEPHHIGTTPHRNHITTANNLGILQRSPAFFSDRDLKWVGDGLEDLGGLGEERVGSYGVLDWQWNLDNWTRDGAEMQGQNRAWDEGKSPQSPWTSEQ